MWVCCFSTRNSKKEEVKTARIGAVRVGRVGQVLPTSICDIKNNSKIFRVGQTNNLVSIVKNHQNT
jgi:hypothetical protein